MRKNDFSFDLSSFELRSSVVPILPRLIVIIVI